ncbi:MAG: GyrI-like domain-containing protein [Chitinophagaceae bacterium]|nr:GyrI-like domain-containing protein [Chitinophagaceae bacterium]
MKTSFRLLFLPLLLATCAVLMCCNGKGKKEPVAPPKDTLIVPVKRTEKVTKAPFFFEAGIQVNKRPGKLSKGVQVRELEAGTVVVAHFYGPYNMMPQGYDAIKEWMKFNKKSAAGAPYEIYVSDPIDKNGKPLDPYKVQTDIVFPVK